MVRLVYKEALQELEWDTEKGDRSIAPWNISWLQGLWNGNCSCLSLDGVVQCPKLTKAKTGLVSKFQLPVYRLGHPFGFIEGPGHFHLPSLQDLRHQDC